VRVSGLTAAKKPIMFVANPVSNCELPLVALPELVDDCGAFVDAVVLCWAAVISDRVF